MEIAPGVYSLTLNKGFEVLKDLIVEPGGLTIIDTLFDYDPVIIASHIIASGRTHHRSECDHLDSCTPLPLGKSRSAQAAEWRYSLCARQWRLTLLLANAERNSFPEYFKIHAVPLVTSHRSQSEDSDT